MVIRKLCLYPVLSKNSHLIFPIFTTPVLVPSNPFISRFSYTKIPMKSSMMLEMHTENILFNPIGVPESVSKCVFFTYLYPVTCIANSNIPSTFINLPGYLLIIFWYSVPFDLSSLFYLFSFFWLSHLVSHPRTF